MATVKELKALVGNMGEASPELERVMNISRQLDALHKKGRKTPQGMV